MMADLEHGGCQREALLQPVGFAGQAGIPGQQHAEISVDQFQDKGALVVGQRATCVLSVGGHSTHRATPSPRSSQLPALWAVTTLSLHGLAPESTFCPLVNAFYGRGDGNAAARQAGRSSWSLSGWVSRARSSVLSQKGRILPGSASSHSGIAAAVDQDFAARRG
jgi:hypothetical protein